MDWRRDSLPISPFTHNSSYLCPFQASMPTHTVSAAMAELEALTDERGDLALMVGRRRQQGRQQPRQEASTQEADQPLFDAKGPPQELQGTLKMVGRGFPGTVRRADGRSFSRHSLCATRSSPLFRCLWRGYTLTCSSWVMTAGSTRMIQDCAPVSNYHFPLISHAMPLCSSSVSDLGDHRHTQVILVRQGRL